VSTADRSRWDARHAAVGLGAPMPPDGLRGRESLLPAAGRALDVACGRGAVAVWLAQRGFTVDAVDVSGVGLESARALAESAGVAEAVRPVEADLDGGLPVEGPYDLVVCQRFRAPALYPALADALAPGGLLVVTVLSGSTTSRASSGRCRASSPRRSARSGHSTCSRTRRATGRRPCWRSGLLSARHHRGEGRRDRDGGDETDAADERADHLRRDVLRGQHGPGALSRHREQQQQR